MRHHPARRNLDGVPRDVSLEERSAREEVQEACGNTISTTRIAQSRSGHATGWHMPAAEPHLMTLGIRRKMLLILVTVLVIAVGVSGWLTMRKQERDLYDAIELRGQEVIKHAANALALYAVSYDYHGIQLLLDELIQSPDLVHAHVTSAKGNLMATAGPISPAQGRHPSFERPIRFDNRQVGTLTIQLDDADIVRRVTESRNELLLRELLLVLLVAIGEFVALSYVIARPIAIISRTLEKNADTELRIEHPIPFRSTDELGRLADHFNRMRKRLNQTQRQLQTRMEAADAQLVQTNQTLILQSEKLKKANQRLIELSRTDALTGLYNRRHFEDIMTRELGDQRNDGVPCSLLIIDIDRFKQINDTHGHAMGDAVLKHFSRQIREGVRQQDIACRIGGEEFAVACRNTSHQEALRLAERLRESAEQCPLIDGNTQVFYTVSIGATTVTTRPTDLDTAFKHADQALYASKETGRNRVSHHLDQPQPAHLA